MLFNFSDFFRDIQATPLNAFYEQFQSIIEREQADLQRHGEWQTWSQQFNQLPNISASSIDFSIDQIRIGEKNDISAEQTSQLTEQLLQFAPWRKGPFDFFGIDIDCEWRSDWKWQRLHPFISDLNGRTVLDVGCGSGYHSMRMHGEGAALTIGIDPTAKFFLQHQVLRKYYQDYVKGLHFLPLRMEHLPSDMQCFDTVFSMGVLYHRKSPFDHLEELKRSLKKGGELILETLIIDGDEQSVLVPHDRYAAMRNVWFLPSQSHLENWLHKLKFKDIRTVDVNTTSIEEQRATEWMNFRSLKDFLDPNDSSKTIEGYPAPKRAIIIANK